MRKKIGEIIALDKKTKDEIKITIWGSIFKTHDGVMLGGVHYNISLELIKDLFPFVQQINESCKRFKFKYVIDEYGTRYRGSAYGNIDEFDPNDTLEDLTYVNPYEDDQFKFNVNIIHKDFDFVIESKMLRDL